MVQIRSPWTNFSGKIGASGGIDSTWDRSRNHVALIWIWICLLQSEWCKSAIICSEWKFIWFFPWKKLYCPHKFLGLYFWAKSILVVDYEVCSLECSGVGALNTSTPYLFALWLLLVFCFYITHFKKSMLRSSFLLTGFSFMSTEG